MTRLKFLPSKMRLLIAIVGFIVLAPRGAFAQYPLSWQDIASSPGYDVIRKGNGDSLFATNGRGVVYLSTDAGFNWSGILGYPSSTTIYDLQVNGSHVAASLYYPPANLHYQGYVWNGTPNDWTRIYIGSFPFSNIVIDSFGTVFGILFGSVEMFDGSTWYTVSQNLPFPTLSGFTPITLPIVIDRDENFIVGTDSAGDLTQVGVYVSRDTGKTWDQIFADYGVTAVSGALRGRILVGASPNPNFTSTGGVFVSADSGKSWKGLGLTDKQITSVVEGSRGAIFALGDGVVYKYTDSSQGWEQESIGGLAYQSLITVPPTTVIASSESAGIIRSADNGSVWAGAEIRGKDVFCIAETDSGDYVCGTLGSGLYRSLYGGNSWVNSERPSLCDYIYTLTRNEGLIYAGSDGGVLVSSDQGLTFTKVSDSLFPGSAYALVLPDDHTLLAGTAFGVYRSTDGGEHWDPSGLGSSKVLFMDGTLRNQIVAGTADDGIFISIDGGASWTSKGLVRDDIQTVQTALSGKILVGVYGGVFASSDAGTIWSFSQFDNSYVYSLENVDTGLIYAGSYHGIFVSQDDGMSWVATQDSGLAEKVVLALYHARDGRSLAGTYRGGIYRSLQRYPTTFLEGVSPDHGVPLKYSLSQNFPNPFNPTTEIVYTLPRRESVQLDIFDVLGRKVITLVRGIETPGYHRIRWDGSRAASGLYFYTLRTEQFEQTRKMLLIR